MAALYPHLVVDLQDGASAVELVLEAMTAGGVPFPRIDAFLQDVLPLEPDDALNYCRMWVTIR